MHFDFKDDVQKINCISYFGLEQGILTYKSHIKKDKQLKNKLIAILDKLYDLDSPHTPNNYINEVRWIFIHIHSSIIIIFKNY